MGHRQRPLLLHALAVATVGVLLGVGPHGAWAGPALTNQLATAPSPYLREAAGHPVAWQAWGEEAFQLARELDRPILLDIGAAWCHWCHVMDGETYSNPEVATLINRYFVPIRVDRDERPDIDRRYQEAMQALIGYRGWPLTVFMTPAGKVFYGGGTFFPDARYGRPAFTTILPRVYEVYRTKREKVVQSSETLHVFVAMQRAASVRPGDLSAALVDAVAQALLDRFSPSSGGFGRGPQHPRGRVVELALKLGAERGNPRMLQIATRTLEAMARGGVRDQLGGGFHRYSMDPRWQVPHFEQMAEIQAEMLVAYLHAYQVTGNPFFREVAEGILGYVNRVLANRQPGGFSAHQDADMGPEDDGGYYTWTVKEVRRALPPAEAEVLILRFDIRATGDMLEAPGQNVLWIARSAEEIAAELGRPVSEITSLLRSGTARLRETRGQRKSPAVDRRILADRNGMLISALLEASKVLGRDDAEAFALKSLDTVWDTLVRPHSGVAHVDYAGQQAVTGFLADHVWVAWALLDAFEATGEHRYLGRAREVVDFLLRTFWDPAAGGFFDTRPQPAALAVLDESVKPILDSATPSPNALAALLLDRLFYLTAERRYHERAEMTLKSMAGAPSAVGLQGATYALAVDQFFNPPPQVAIIGSRTDLRTRTLRHAALASYRFGKTVASYDPAHLRLEDLPPAVAAKVRNTPQTEGPKAYVCVGTVCSLPTDDPGRLGALVKHFGLSPRPSPLSEVRE